MGLLPERYAACPKRVKTIFVRGMRKYGLEIQPEVSYA